MSAFQTVFVVLAIVVITISVGFIVSWAVEAIRRPTTPLKQPFQVFDGGGGAINVYDNVETITGGGAAGLDANAVTGGALYAAHTILPGQRVTIDLGLGVHTTTAMGGCGLVDVRVAPPIDIILHCPRCNWQHIDGPAPHVAGCKAVETDHGDCNCNRWLNPPHRSHLCAGCGCIWRPADVATNGVEAIKTKGREDWA